jgi:hypothetical protein
MTGSATGKPCRNMGLARYGIRAILSRAGRTSGQGQDELHFMATIIAGDYEWHDVKAADNVTKHDVSFEEAVVALADPDSLDLDDPNDPTRVISLDRAQRAASAPH